MQPKMHKFAICLLFFVVPFIFSYSIKAPYIRPVVTKTLISQCKCGFIVPQTECTSTYQDIDMQCGMLNIFYTTTKYPDCDKAYVSCTKTGPEYQSVGIVGKVRNKSTNETEWSLIGNRKLTTNYQIWTCNNDGTWIHDDLEGNTFDKPVQIQCASSSASEAFDYYIS